MKRAVAIGAASVVACVSPRPPPAETAPPTEELVFGSTVESYDGREAPGTVAEHLFDASSPDLWTCVPKEPGVVLVALHIDANGRVKDPHVTRHAGKDVAFASCIVAALRKTEAAPSDAGNAVFRVDVERAADVPLSILGALNARRDRKSGDAGAR